MKTKTIDVNAKEWIDKKHGNSYFCGTVTLNYGMKNEETFLMPFQYGSSYLQEAKATLIQFNKISANWDLSLYSYCKENKIIFRCNLKQNCLQRELKQIEVDYNRNLETA